MSQESLDIAFEKFTNRREDFEIVLSKDNSESDIRLKIIDPIFCDILGWSLSDISTEEDTGKGFLDYKFSIDNLSRLVVEAKRDSVSFGLNGRSSGNAYKLKGPVLSKKPQPSEGILQAIGYCGIKNCELSCVTNGSEWILFRANRAGDGLDTREGMAFVFTSLEQVEANFPLFFDLLAKEKVRNFSYRAYFQEAEGQPIRARPFSKTLRAVDSYRLIEKSTLAQDIDRVMTEFFRKLSGENDPEMLAQCFVTTKESQIADEKLARVTESIATKIRNLDTEQSTALSNIFERVKDSGRNEFVIIIGTKGAGKSTFIERFFKHILKKRIYDNCIIIRVDVGSSNGDYNNIIKWLNQQLLLTIESKLFGEGGPSFEELQGMFFDEYTRRMNGPYKFLYESNKTEFKVKFGEHIDKIRSENTQEYINRLIRHIVASRRKVPCIILDNTDHFSIEFQQSVFQYARSIYEQEVCLVIVPITDKTSWQLSQQGALQSFDSESFYLPTPLPKTVVERRIRYLEELVRSGKIEKGSGYFTERGIGLSLENLDGFVTSLQHVFLETGNVSNWIGNLANRDIRRCLKLSRDLVASPYLRVDELVKAYIAGNSKNISELDTKRAVIKRGYNIYPTGQNEFVQNIFALNMEIESTPLLGLRILRLLRDAKHHDAGGLEDYVDIEQAQEYMYSIGVERRATLLCLDVMLKTGLCFSHDPTITKIEKARRVQLSPSGLQHLIWGSWDETYISIMSQVTPISSEPIYTQMKGYEEKDPNERWMLEVICFIHYLLNEDDQLCLLQQHEAFEGQVKLSKSLSTKVCRLENIYKSRFETKTRNN